MPPTDGGPPASQDPRALVEQLYAAHAARIRRRLRWLGVPEHSLDDAVQHVFLIAYLLLAGGEGPITVPGPWLSEIARKTAPRFRRAAPAEAIEEALDMVAPAADPEARAGVRDLLCKLAQRIDPDKLSILVAVRIEGLTWEEAAREHGLSVRGARKRADEALEELRRELRRREAAAKRRGIVRAPLTVEALLDAERAGAGAEHAAIDPEPPRLDLDPHEAIGDPALALDHGSHLIMARSILSGAGARAPARTGGVDWRRPARLLGRAAFPAATACAGVVCGLLFLSPRVQPALALPAWITAVPSAAAALPAGGAPSPAVVPAAATAGERSARAPSHASRGAIAAGPATIALRAQAPAPRSTLQEEQRLIDDARSAIEAGDLLAAAGALSEHARRFPAGHFARRRAATLARLCASPQAATERLPACARAPGRPG
ncbi:MAG: sigma-70 family RNA polymerase sigma factor [Polyangiaceae bacterium]|nr:sigma-70 family RNA polymerase sigma factor [Polyangiaceae bacterium]